LSIIVPYNKVALRTSNSFYEESGGRSSEPFTGHLALSLVLGDCCIIFLNCALFSIITYSPPSRWFSDWFTTLSTGVFCWLINIQPGFLVFCQGDTAWSSHIFWVGSPDNLDTTNFRWGIQIPVFAAARICLKGHGHGTSNSRRDGGGI